MKKNHQSIFTFVAIASNWIQRHPETSKFKYALHKMVQRGTKIQGEYQEQAEDISVKHCATDDKGVILPKEGNDYRFTKEGITERNKERLALFKKEVEIEPFMAPINSLPLDLTFDEMEAFLGFVLPEDFLEMLTEATERQVETSAAGA